MSLKDRRHNTGHAEQEVETKAMPMASFAPQHPPVEEQLPFPDNHLIPSSLGRATPQKDFPGTLSRPRNVLAARSRTAETPPPDVPASYIAFPAGPSSSVSPPGNEAATAQPLP